MFTSASPVLRGGGGENSGAQAVLSAPALINSDGLGSRLNCTIIRRQRNRGW